MKNLKNVSTPDLERMRAAIQEKAQEINLAIAKGISNDRVADAFQDTVTQFNRSVAAIDAELARRGGEQA